VPDLTCLRSRLVSSGLVAGALALAGCGESGGDTVLRPAEDAGPEHIHGLGINPADGSLVIATHTGLFRAGPDERRARRVSEKYQDTMGFTVIGPDRFLGSGHPDLRDDLPPLLGLVRSDDAGRTWRPISLLGQADFHVLRAVGKRVYGVNSADGQLLASEDQGRSWERRAAPGALVDLVADGAKPEHVVASTEDGLFWSADAGRRWRPLVKGRAGLLAWPAPYALYLVDGRGEVHRSASSGRTWRRAGRIGGQPAAFSWHASDLYVALHTNEVKVSRDGGRSWQLRLAAS
jgi:hypothetical protein